MNDRPPLSMQACMHVVQMADYMYQLRQLLNFLQSPVINYILQCVVHKFMLAHTCFQALWQGCCHRPDRIVCMNMLPALYAVTVYRSMDNVQLTDWSVLHNEYHTMHPPLYLCSVAVAWSIEDVCRQLQRCTLHDWSGTEPCPQAVPAAMKSSSYMFSAICQICRPHHKTSVKAVDE